MNYMDVKALSEIADSYDALVKIICRGRRELEGAGIDASLLENIGNPVVRDILKGRTVARGRCDRARQLYLSSLSTSKTGRAA